MLIISILAGKLLGQVNVKVQEFVRYQFHEYVDKQIKDDIRET